MPARGERVLPHDEAAEKAVLGAMMIDPEALTKVPFLRPEHFYRANHGEVLRAGRELFRRGEPIDFVTVADELSRMGVMQRMDRSDIASLTEEVATSAGIVYHAEIVRAHSVKREGIQRATDLVQQGFDATIGDREYLSAFQSTAMKLADESLVSETARLGDLMPGFLAEYDALERGERRGLSTGYASMDSLMGGGMMPGDLILLAARSSMGKTALAVNIALRVAMRGTPVAFFSLEMSKEQLVGRIVAMHARLSAKRMKLANLSDSEKRRLNAAAVELSDAALMIEESNAIDEVTVAAKARQLALRDEGLGLIVLDYLQLLGSSRDFRGNRVHEVGHLSHSLKQLARDLKVPVIALSQLSRAPDHRANQKDNVRGARPHLSDLRDSGELEQDADIVIFAYRDDYYDEQKNPGMAEAIFAKNRNGELGTVHLRFAKDQQRFDEIDTRHDPPPQAQRGRAPVHMQPDDYQED